MRLIYRSLILCLALGMALPSQAEQLRGLYQVREAVSGQQAQERAAALQRAFDTLLLRLTGDAEVGKRQAVAALREDPQQLISKYGYEGEHIVVDFDPGTTERSLRRAGVALWGANRPSVLAWWLNERVEGTQLLGDGQDSAAPLRAAAQHRGLPLRLPLADLSEQLLATPEAFGANSQQTLGEASERYDADVLLAVHARQGDSGWQAQWKVWLDDGQRDGKAEGENLEALADAVMILPWKSSAPTWRASLSWIACSNPSAAACYGSKAIAWSTVSTPAPSSCVRSCRWHDCTRSARTSCHWMRGSRWAKGRKALNPPSRQQTPRAALCCASAGDPPPCDRSPTETTVLQGSHRA